MNSEKVQIRGAGFCYDVHVGRGLMNQVGLLTRERVRGRRAAIITDSNIPRVIIDKVKTSLAETGFQVATVAIQPGENSKSLAEVERVCGEIANLDRSSVIVGLGGGVVGDLSGFIAAVFHRGIPHVQVPTTLLAMVDSAIGGKTGVNLAAGKNLVGAIHHPMLVMADVDALEMLPQRELRQGYAEIVKHAIICDAEMFELLSTSSLDFAWDEIILRNIRIKAAIVSRDDRDLSGERALLNFGHTVGHGIERASEFRIPHGECVSLGLVAACNISVRCAGMPVSQRDEVITVLQRLGLPTQLPSGLECDKVMEAITRDKKFADGEVCFVVTPEVGKAFLSRDVSFDDIRQSLVALSQ